MRTANSDTHPALIALAILALLLTPPDDALARQKKRQTHAPTHQSARKAGHTKSRQRHTQKKISVAPVAPVIPVTPDAGLNHDARISELRSWLNQRNTERDHELEPTHPESGSLLSESAPVRLPPLNRKRLNLSYTPPAAPTGEEPDDPGSVLRIGRGPDGRVYHRYVLRDADTEVTRLSDRQDDPVSPLLERRRQVKQPDNPDNMGTKTGKTGKTGKARRQPAVRIARKATRQPARKTTRRKPSRHR